MPRAHPVVASVTLLLSLVVRAQAQESSPPADEHQHIHETAPDVSPSWTWSGDGSVFAGYNYQQRRFADFASWESQNWFGANGQRRLGAGQFGIDAMISLEPFSMPASGSPQLFQTGESYQQSPLVNHQHPHDLLMNLGATYRATHSRFTYVAGADLVGSPALGPVPFMHRESARDNPQVPLTHHFLDSTHSTAGVVRGGIEVAGLTLESSVFRGEEPDENRRNIDQPRLNSWSARIGWQRGPWQTQFSGGHLHEPEWFEPYDVTRLTASIAFSGTVRSHAVAATLAWGENRQEVVANGVSDGFLLEWDVRATNRLSLYGRAEATEKELFGLGFHPKGFAHPHLYSHVDALTLGIVPDLLTVIRGRFGVGVDITLFHMSSDLLQYWEGSRSYHVFVRWRPTGVPPHHH